MKTLILYRSFLGSSKQYAEWLHEDIPSDIMKFGKDSDNILDSYDSVVLFCGTYATRLSLAGYLKRNWGKLQRKRVVFVTVAATSAESRFSVAGYSRIPDKIRVSIKHFHLLGKGSRANVAVFKKENIQAIVEYLKSL